MTANTNRLTNWMPLALLVVLGLLPLLPAAGRMVVRFADVGAPPEMLEDTSRFFVMPVPVVVHIVSACLFSLVGALQFSKALRRSPWHRLSGRVMVVAGILAAASGLWLTNFYPPLGNEGPLLYWFRSAAGLGMLWFVVQGYRAAIALLPETDLGVVLLWNSESALPSALMPTILDRALGLPPHWLDERTLDDTLYARNNPSPVPDDEAGEGTLSAAGSESATARARPQ